MPPQKPKPKWIPPEWMQIEAKPPRPFKEILDNLPEKMRVRGIADLPYKEKLPYYNVAVELADAFLHERMLEQRKSDILKVALRHLLPEAALNKLLVQRREKLGMKQYAPASVQGAKASMVRRSLFRRGKKTPPHEAVQDFEWGPTRHRPF